MIRVIVMVAASLLAVGVGSAFADDRCLSISADIAVQDAKIDGIAAALEKSWPVIDMSASAAEAGLRADASADSPELTEVCALISAGLALHASKMLLLERMMDMAEDLTNSCPGHTEIASILSAEASDAMDPIFNRMDLLKSRQGRFCADGGN